MHFLILYLTFHFFVWSSSFVKWVTISCLLPLIRLKGHSVQTSFYTANNMNHVYFETTSFGWIRFTDADTDIETIMF